MDNDAAAPERGRGSVMLGLVLAVLLTVVSFFVGPRTCRILGVSNPLGWVIFFGAFQWIYLLPLIIFLNAKHQPRTAKGLLVVGLLVVVANIAMFQFLWHGS
ncbi:MAG TPA: hypothetical protein VGI46_20335 [Candidatus Acidoferrum sp.]|jgi:heme/copper-type cytochrome/quinol oxidase subunit 4